MVEKFIRFKAIDGVELCGILYTPEKVSKKTIIHVHGLAGNFYENRFVSYLAEMYTSKGYNFLTYNNRGNGYFSDLLKEVDGNITFVNGGGAYERFEESRLDLDGIIKYLETIGNEEIILEGHSLGCNKVIDYYHKNKKNVSKIILLAPCDIIEEIKVFMGTEYEKCVNEANILLKSGKEEEIINSPIFPITFSARTFVNDWLPNALSDIFRYRENNYIHPQLDSIDIPVLIEIGNQDECALVVSKEKVIKYFENNLSKYKLNFVDNAPHNYLSQEILLTNDIKEWL